MDRTTLASFFDHTLLKPDAKKTEIEKLCHEAREFGFFAVCVNGYWLDVVRENLKGSNVKAAVVTGFPLGAMRLESKVEETKRLCDLGADEIDMVINIGAYLSNEKEYVYDEIAALREVSRSKVLKVIVETAFLSTAQIQDLTRICLDTKVDFIKTSTGFASRGASRDDVLTMKQLIDQSPRASLQIKASGGIRTLQDAQIMIDVGATRLGASASVSILNEM